MHGHPKVTDGRYACDVVNQHAVSWCGACYLVAAAQMVQDRAHIQRGSPLQLSMQVLMDHYREPDVDAVWNACHGGHPLQVLKCMGDGTCPLVVINEVTPQWLGFVRLLTRCPKPTVDDFAVANARRIPEELVRQDLWHRGPIVLEVCAQTLTSTDMHGVVRDLTPRDPNHAVCVVGIEQLSDGTACWIVRNSWGTAQVPRDIPRDYQLCASYEQNTCIVDWEPWSGDPRDPGFCLLPTSFQPLHNRNPSPWVACDIVFIQSDIES